MKYLCVLLPLFFVLSMAFPVFGQGFNHDPRSFPSNDPFGTEKKTQLAKVKAKVTQSAILALRPVENTENASIEKNGTSQKAIDSAKKYLTKQYQDAESEGNEKADLCGPVKLDGKDMYFWAVTGTFAVSEKEVRGLVGHERKATKNYKKVNHDYFYICYFNNSQKAIDVFFSVDFDSKYENKAPLSAINKVCYRNACEKNDWTVGGRTIKGTLAGYKNKMVDLLEEIEEGKTRKISMSVARLSQADQNAIFFILCFCDIPVTGTYKPQE